MSISKFICHKNPERTFRYKNNYFPICSRCTGFYLGILVSFPIIFFYLEYFQMINLFFLGLVFLIPMFLDGSTQFLEFRKSNNKLRFITGLIGGLGIGILIFKILLKFNLHI